MFPQVFAFVQLMQLLHKFCACFSSEFLLFLMYFEPSGYTRLGFSIVKPSQSQFSLAELSYKIGFRPLSQPPPLGSLQLDKFGSQGQMSLIGTLWVRLENICIMCLDFNNT